MSFLPRYSTTVTSRGCSSNDQPSSVRTVMGWVKRSRDHCCPPLSVVSVTEPVVAFPQSISKVADPGPIRNDLSKDLRWTSSTVITRQQYFLILGTRAIRRVPSIVNAHFLSAISSAVSPRLSSRARAP